MPSQCVSGLCYVYLFYICIILLNDLNKICAFYFIPLQIGKPNLLSKAKAVVAGVEKTKTMVLQIKCF